MKNQTNLLHVYKRKLHHWGLEKNKQVFLIIVFFNKLEECLGNFLVETLPNGSLIICEENQYLVIQ